MYSSRITSRRSRILLSTESCLFHLQRRNAFSNPPSTLRQTLESNSPSKTSISSSIPPRSNRPDTESIWYAVRTHFGFQPRHKPIPGYQPAPFTVATNPYHAKKVWPPDFERLTPRHKFHFEKTYRRRAKLKFSMPGWKRAVTLLQNTIIVTVIIFWLFFMDMEGHGTPAQGLRNWIAGLAGEALEGTEGSRGRGVKEEQDVKATAAPVK